MTVSSTVWQQLKCHRLTCDQALTQLVDETGTVNLALVDPEVSDRFFRHFPDEQTAPPVMPLLLWQNCYYLGSPVALSPAQLDPIANGPAVKFRWLRLLRKAINPGFCYKKSTLMS